jgi:hypothetical protein
MAGAEDQRWSRSWIAPGLCRESGADDAARRANGRAAGFWPTWSFGSFSPTGGNRRHASIVESFDHRRGRKIETSSDGNDRQQPQKKNSRSHLRIQ